MRAILKPQNTVQAAKGNGVVKCVFFGIQFMLNLLLKKLIQGKLCHTWVM